MALRRCDNNVHFFNPEQFSACPYCRGVAPGAAPVGVTSGYRPQDFAAQQVAGVRPQQAPAPSPVARGTAPAEATVGVARKLLGFEPVVGWLVCTAGPTRGQDYRIPDGASVVGRGEAAHIRIEDPTISQHQVSIVFDRRTSHFFVTPGQGRNPTYVNGAVLLSERKLEARDGIEMGSSFLVFVPFCGDQFSWVNAPKASP